ncbi:lipopolysaccharide heptosyltransferase I [Sulfurovum sp.]|uniref:lipopolysaccharide heptosyltransferase I n=1 Tax=Sulfurovum sp. TaxID=1969726 RepID=UPI00262003DE|nr:lipopolysaccharide heptosyltransferase I [Sulfurovum sp.]
MRIAIVKLSALGDIVHAMVVLQFIREAMPQSRIDWIVEEHFSGILEYNPHIDTILPVNLKALKKEKSHIFSEFRRLKAYVRNRYDLVIDMQGLIKSAVVARILGPSCGFDRHSVREKAAALLYSRTFRIPYEKNVIMRNADLVAAALNFEIGSDALMEKKPFLFYPDSACGKTVSFLMPEKKNIVHILGSSWESKVYPKEKFVEIIEALPGNHLLVWGNDAEKSRADFIAGKCEAGVLPPMNLNELKALIAAADLVIGGDSGPTHMAWALNRPSITIFGPTPSFRNVLETKINRVIDCGKKIDPLKLDKNELCINTISAHNIVTLAKELLS